MANCAKCGAALAEGAGFCPSCGTPVAGASPASGAGASSGAASSSGLTSNVAAMLAYFTIIPAILFLVIDPYNKDKFVRFHSFQCLFLAGAAFAASIALGIISAIPFIGWLVGIVLFPLLWLTVLAIAIFCMYKAYSNEKFMLPVIGKIAEEQSSK